MPTKLSKLVGQFHIKNKKKIDFFEKSFAFSMFFLFLGFVCGNLFGTFLTFFRNFTSWDGIIIIMTILLIEFINYLSYATLKKDLKKKLTVEDKNENAHCFFSFKKNILLFLNFYKIGILLGFFTDAFKVGS
jgi:cytochrome c biogenesis protein CcdA